MTEKQKQEQQKTTTTYTSNFFAAASYASSNGPKLVNIANMKLIQCAAKVYTLHVLARGFMLSRHRISRCVFKCLCKMAVVSTVLVEESLK